MRTPERFTAQRCMSCQLSFLTMCYKFSHCFSRLHSFFSVSFWLFEQLLVVLMCWCIYFVFKIFLRWKILQSFLSSLFHWRCACGGTEPNATDSRSYFLYLYVRAHTSIYWELHTNTLSRIFTRIIWAQCIGRYCSLFTRTAWNFFLLPRYAQLFGDYWIG